MRYLKTFEQSEDPIFNLPSKFDTDCLEEIKSIFDEFAEERDYYKYKWELLANPMEEGVLYTYFTWIELLEQQYQEKNKLSARINNGMLLHKYFNININITQAGSEVGHVPISLVDAKNRSQIIKDSVLQDVEKYFINRIKSIGYKVDILFGSSSGNNIYTEQITLKINYSEV